MTRRTPTVVLIAPYASDTAEASDASAGMFSAFSRVSMVLASSTGARVDEH